LAQARLGTQPELAGNPTLHDVCRVVRRLEGAPKEGCGRRADHCLVGQPSTIRSATRKALATIVSVGFTLPLVGCSDESHA